MRALALLALVAGCDDRITEVVVMIDQSGLQVPRDLDQVGLTVTDTSLPDGSPPQLTQPPVPLCATGSTDACYRFPLSVTLTPGPSRPGDTVRVEVQALRGGAVVIDDAGSFSFKSGARERLYFMLYAGCLSVSCAATDLSCDATGGCAPLAKTPL